MRLIRHTQDFRVLTFDRHRYEEEVLSVGGVPPGKLVTLSGTGASGKTSVFHKLRLHPKISILPAYTTRKARDGERSGEELFTCDRSDFEYRLLRGEFVLGIERERRDPKRHKLKGWAWADVSRALHSPLVSLMEADMRELPYLNAALPISLMIVLDPRQADLEIYQARRGLDRDDQLEYRNLIRRVSADPAISSYLHWFENPDGRLEETVGMIEKLIMEVSSRPA